MHTNVTIAGLWRPEERSWALAYDVVLVLVGTLLIALSAQIAIGFPVPISAQTFAVVLIGALLGPRRGAICMLAYLAEGVAGVPVFAQGKAGLAVLAGPTGGYLVGFVPAAWVVGLLARSGWDRRFWTTLAAMLIGNVVIYVFGLLLLAPIVGVDRAVSVGLYPFVIGDVAKAVLAAILLPAGWKLLDRFQLHAEQ